MMRLSRIRPGIGLVALETVLAPVAYLCLANFPEPVYPEAAGQIREYN
jgi:hypothetical protein